MANFPNSVMLNTSIGRMAVVQPGVEALNFSATLAEIIATKVICPKIPGFKYRIIGFLLRFNGNAATADDIRLSTTASTPVDIATVLIANAADGDKRNEADATAVLGAGFNAENASGEGVLIRETGTNLTGTTSVTGVILYQLIRG